MTRPHRCARIGLSTSRQHRTIPVRPTAMVSFHTARSMSSAGDSVSSAAEFTRTSTLEPR